MIFKHDGSVLNDMACCIVGGRSCNLKSGRHVRLCAHYVCVCGGGGGGGGGGG